jgi:outer membrane receptor protein involved in Fe transport
VQVITPVPAFSNQAAAIRGKTFGAWSSGDLGRTLYAELEGGFEKTAVRAGAGFQQYGDRRTGAGERIAPSGYESRFGDLKLVRALGNHMRLMLSAQYMEQPSTPRIDELVAGFGELEPSSVLYQFEPNRREFYHGQLTWMPERGAIERIELNIAQQTITDDRRTQETRSTTVVEEFNSSKLYGVTAQANLRAGEYHQLVIGAEAYADTILSRRIEMRVDGETSQPVQPRFPDGSTMDSVAVYIQDEWSPHPDWGVTGGLRYSHYAVGITDESTGSPLKISPDDLTASLGLRYHVSPKLTLVGNIGRGFRPPNIFDLGTLGSRPGNRFNIANVNLGPESALGIDGGLRWKTEFGFGEVFFFYTDYRDRITSVATGEQTDEGRTIVRSENAGKATLYGVEAIVGFRLSNNLTGEAVMNYTHGVQVTATSTSSPDDRIPPLNGRVSTIYRINDAMSLRTDLLFSAKQDRLSDRDIADPRIDPEGTAGWAVLNAAVEIRGKGGFRYGIRGANIFDKRYREHGSGIDAVGRSLGLWFSFELN